MTAAAAASLAHRPPCAWSRATMWLIVVLLGVVAWVAAATNARVEAMEQRVERNTGDVREYRTSIRYIEEGISRIEAELTRRRND